MLFNYVNKCYKLCNEDAKAECINIFHKLLKCHDTKTICFKFNDYAVSSACEKVQSDKIKKYIHEIDELEQQYKTKKTMTN